MGTMNRLHRILLGTTLSLGILPFPCLAAEYRAASEISKVTLFLDRAEVTRRVELNAAPGSHEVLLNGVPQSIAPESLRASGRGLKGGTILGVELMQIPLRSDPSIKVQELTDKAAQLSRERDSLARTKERLEKQRQMLISLELNQTIPESEKVIRPRTPKEIAELLSLIDDRQRKIDQELGQITLSNDKITKELQYTQNLLAQLQVSQLTESAIAVSLASEVTGPIELEVSYQVRNASWRPAYNLTGSEGKGSPHFSLDTYALVTQRTGEDWGNVALTLSTARPNVRLDRPDPRPLFLELFRPVPAISAMRKEAEKMTANSALDEAAVFETSMERGKTELQSFNAPAADISLGAVVSYKVTHPVTLKSDGSTEKVMVSTTELEGALTHVAVPALSNEVYREAVLQNAGQAPLLPGSLALFSNGEFLGSRKLALTQPGEEMRFPIGISQQVTAKRTLLKSFEDDSGIVHSTRRIRHDYLIEVVNNSEREQSIIVLESAPLSRNEKITVNFDDVVPESLSMKNKARVKPLEGVLEWHLSLSPKGKQEIRYSTVVEFPAAEQVSGLERL